MVQMRATKHAGGVGGKCEAVHMGGVLQGRLQYLVRRLPSGRRRWHLRAANLQPETCARMPGTWGVGDKARNEHEQVRGSFVFSTLFLQFVCCQFVHLAVHLQELFSHVHGQKFVGSNFL